jgi:membrane protease YdiL (CAAX protease family)
MTLEPDFSLPPAHAEGSPVEPEVPVAVSPQLLEKPKLKDPPWSGWDVLQIAILTIVAVVFFLPLLAFAAKRLLYPRVPLVDVVTYPIVTVLGQMLAYLLVLVFMMSIVSRVPGQNLWAAIHWNWPQNWHAYLLGGIILSFGLQAIAHFLPIPKELPMDRFFRTPGEAWALSLFGMTFAPLLEELFFRGFLYPVLVRRLGDVGAVVLTAASFSLIHAPQLGRAWGPVLVIFLVGLALTITRKVTNSVAAGLIMHMAYNGTLSVLLFAGTSGFRHMERLSQ